LTTSSISRLRVTATENISHNLVANILVSINVISNRYIILFDISNAIKKSRKTIIMLVRRFAKTLAIRNIKSRYRILLLLVDTFKYN